MAKSFSFAQAGSATGGSTALNGLAADVAMGPMKVAPFVNRIYDKVLAWAKANNQDASGIKLTVDQQASTVRVEEVVGGGQSAKFAAHVFTAANDDGNVVWSVTTGSDFFAVLADNPQSFTPGSLVAGAMRAANFDVTAIVTLSDGKVQVSPAADLANHVEYSPTEYESPDFSQVPPPLAFWL